MGITLKAARVNVGMTQREAAEVLGVSRETLQNYEAGKKFPSVPTIKRMEKLYKIPYADLIFQMKTTL
ncbi:helix-turn-helix transcriptional regulator [Selenomonas sp.]|uniref:helix-turn-helix transcriptional regulator n=1 Tax=Selenomonas sp. TaxID=2053611 RepID=UPI0025D2604E|nr:helix-turn-helix transcriptional regulator [Selenomonas sp.]MCI6086235.1 helix-turn-helix domain-containing protein [Selenomonas sp.]MDY3298638.1 helix-turn-helix transcriptional regulator [Selenomonas sp.]MDY4416198.1 helix-turn-helix transcriptional regulator [Selenomonas sp.]